MARFAAAAPAVNLAASVARRWQLPATPSEKRAAEQSGPSPAAILSIVVAAAVVLFVGYEFYQYRAGAPAAVPVAVASAGSRTLAAGGSQTWPRPDPSADAADSLAAIPAAGHPFAPRGQGRENLA